MFPAAVVVPAAGTLVRPAAQRLEGRRVRAFSRHGATFAASPLVFSVALSVTSVTVARRVTRLGRRAGAGKAVQSTEEVDAVVIGSGIGGLCAGSVLSKYGQRVVICEAHGSAGGAAHGFSCKLPKEGGDFFFDTGPSFFSGLSDPDGARINPLKAVFDLLEVELPCHQYRSFGLCLPEGDFTHTPDFGNEILAPVSGKAAKKEWDSLLQAMKPLAALVEALPVPALRSDLGALLTAGRFLRRFAAAGPWGATQLTDPFAETVQRAGLNDPFARSISSFPEGVDVSSRTSKVSSTKLVSIGSASPARLIRRSH
eukprot:symbB.v1.2.020895.t1/scaffold1782.1/size101530/1